MAYIQRTPEEKEDVITRLLALKETLPSHSMFGDPNHEIIDTQIEIIRGIINDEDDIYDMEDNLGQMGVSDCVNVLSWLSDSNYTVEDFLED